METAVSSLLPIVVAAEKNVGMPLTQILIPVGIMVFIFYFLVMRPQKRFQKERQTMLQALGKHDQVLTRGGIFGTVTDIRTEKDEVIVEIAKNTRVRMRRAAIEAVIPREGGEPKEDREKNR